ncbi:MAG: hypothetical protein ICV60_10075 [Pyrinomonadaceae bacterium]|nr:hypothetical protein [Pyrinomonadaceae bacterium]
MKREEPAHLQAKLFEHADLKGGDRFSLQRKLFTSPAFSVKLLSLSVPAMYLRYLKKGGRLRASLNVSLRAPLKGQARGESRN